MKLDDIDWESWEPQQRATILFVIRDGEILLIRKKRGLGAGKVNGPGGRLHPGETPPECAVREVQEELCVDPVNIRHSGQLRFQFVDGLSLHVYVYRASDCIGTPVETDEAAPLWTRVDEIPYDEMWEDDRHWIPALLDGRPFDGRFVFDGDTMLDHHISFRRR